jgi:hypothetical protein
MSTTLITPQQILNDRAIRKTSGLVGCITGRPEPELDFFGFRDVQIWNMDATGRMPGHEGFNRKNPCCFCFDHRDAFDPKGEVDAELVNEGHLPALYTYRNLVPNVVLPPQDSTENPSQSSPSGGEPAGETTQTMDPPGFSNEPQR